MNFYSDSSCNSLAFGPLAITADGTCRAISTGGSYQVTNLTGAIIGGVVGGVVGLVLIIIAIIFCCRCAGVACCTRCCGPVPTKPPAVIYVQSGQAQVQPPPGTMYAQQPGYPGAVPGRRN